MSKLHDVDSSGGVMAYCEPTELQRFHPMLGTPLSQVSSVVLTPPSEMA